MERTSSRRACSGQRARSSFIGGPMDGKDPGGQQTVREEILEHLRALADLGVSEIRRWEVRTRTGGRGREPLAEASSSRNHEAAGGRTARGLEGAEPDIVK